MHSFPRIENLWVVEINLQNGSLLEILENTAKQTEMSFVAQEYFQFSLSVYLTL